MKSTRKIGLLVVLLAGGSYAAHALYRSSHYLSTDDATVESQLVNLAPRISGVIEEVRVSEHQQVKKGQLLVRLQAQDYQTAVQQARAHVRNLREVLHSQHLRVLFSQQQVQADLEQGRARIGVAQARIAEARQAEGVSLHLSDSSQLGSQQARLGIETARRRWAASRQQERAAQAQADRAQLDWGRYQKLYAQEAISKQQLDGARAEWLTLRDKALSERQQAAALQNEVRVQNTAYRGGLEDAASRRRGDQQARATTRRSQAELVQAQAQLHLSESGLVQVAIEKQALRENEARLAEALQQLRQAELNLSYTKLYAPWDGIVGQRPDEVGAYLKAGQVAVQLVSLHPWVIANFKETQLANLRPGQVANVWVDVNSKQKLAARVDSLQPATGSRFSLIPPENASGNWVKVVQRIPVKLVLEHPPASLLPGMSATVEVEVR